MPKKGLEPLPLTGTDPKSAMYTNFITSANLAT